VTNTFGVIFGSSVSTNLNAILGIVIAILVLVLVGLILSIKRGASVVPEKKVILEQTEARSL